MVRHAIVLADEDWYKAMTSNLKMYITLLLLLLNELLR